MNPRMQQSRLLKRTDQAENRGEPTMASGGATPPRGSKATPNTDPVVDQVVEAAETQQQRVLPPMPVVEPESPMEQTAGGGRTPFLRRVQQVLNGDSAPSQTFVPGAEHNGSEVAMSTQELGAVGSLDGAARVDQGRVVVTTQASAPEPAFVQQRLAPPRPDSGPTASNRPGQLRQARLRLKRVDPWSVFKTALLLSIAFGIMTIVSVLIVWSVLGAAGVWDSVNATVQSVVGGQDGTTFQVEDYVGMQRVVGFTMLVSVIDVFLLTAIATLSAFLYNMAAALLGGLELTLVEDN